MTELSDEVVRIEDATDAAIYRLMRIGIPENLAVEMSRGPRMMMLALAKGRRIALNDR